MIRLRVATRVAVALLLVAACRPPIGGDAEPSASSIAGDLVPSKEIAVSIHLPGAPDALASAITKAAGYESIAGAGVQLEIVVPYPGEDAFEVRTREGQTDIFFATPSAALVAREAGHDLVMIAGLQQRAGLLLFVPAKSSKGLQETALESVLVQGRPGDEAPLLALYDQEGVDRSSLQIEYMEDPSSPLDLFGLFDNTYGSALINSYDGAARIQEFYDLESGVPLGPDGSTLLAGIPGDALESAPGIGIWAKRTALDDDDQRIAMALTLIAIADGLEGCRDDVPACAVVMEDSAIFDRYGDGLLWSVNAFNATVWPATGGALAINETALGRALELTVSVGLIQSAPSVNEIVDRRVLDLALQHLPQTIDLEGATWEPIQVQLPLE